MSVADFTALDEAGLNLQAVIDLDSLPAETVAELRRRFDPAGRFRQLILIGHAGKTLWDSVKAAASGSENPIDDFTVTTIEQWFATQFSGNAHAIVYPGDLPVGLQALGRVAGWHHPSPLMIGISESWGTWYAYRAVVLADTALAPTLPLQTASPCDRCAEKICIDSCPGCALADGVFSLEKCVAYRKAESSRCKVTCVARVSCPVGVEHRYGDEQLAHTYSISLKAIERYC